MIIALMTRAGIEAISGTQASPNTGMIIALMTRAGIEAISGTQASPNTGMIIALMTRAGIEVLCTVRREAQAEMLRRDHGVKHVLLTTSSSFEQELEQRAAELGCRLAFDCTGGEPTCTLLRAMPARSTVYIYGVLLNEPDHVLKALDPGLFIFSNKQLRGFFLLDHLQTLPLHRVARMAFKVPGLLKSDLRTHVRATYPFEQAEEAILDYVGNMTGGKVVLTARG